MLKTRNQIVPTVTTSYATGVGHRKLLVSWTMQILLQMHPGEIQSVQKRSQACPLGRKCLATAVTGNSSIAAWQAVAILLYWPPFLPHSHPEGSAK